MVRVRFVWGFVFFGWGFFGGWVYRVMWRDLLYPGFVFFLYVGVGFRGGWVFGVDGVGDWGFM